MTPTDKIPFTRGMAATIAAGLDHAGAHTSATALRRLADEATTAKAPYPHPGTYRAGYAAAESKAGDTIAALQTENTKLREYVSLWEENNRDELAETVRLMTALGVVEEVEAGKACMDAMLEKITALQSQLAAEREAVRVFATDFYQRNLKPYSREYQDNVIGGITDPIARAAIEKIKKEMK